MKMASTEFDDFLTLRDLVKEYSSLLTDVFDLSMHSKANALYKIVDKVHESRASISECNTLVYEMVKNRLISEGKINHLKCPPYVLLEASHPTDTVGRHRF